MMTEQALLHDNAGETTALEDNPIIGRIKQAESEARGIIEDAEREAMETLRQAKMKAQQVADEPIDISGMMGKSAQLESVKTQIKAINAENEKTIASMKESAGKKRGETAEFIVSLVMKEEA